MTDLYFATVYTKGTKRYPARATEYEAIVVPNKSITFRVAGSDHKVTFNVGEEAEHGSYNLTYSGKILNIGPKTVTVDASDIGRGPKRLSIHEFCWRNIDFNKERAAAQNAETMMYI